MLQGILRLALRSEGREVGEVKVGLMDPEKQERLTIVIVITAVIISILLLWAMLIDKI